jgi:arylsulfatase A-like enzyme
MIDGGCWSPAVTATVTRNGRSHPWRPWTSRARRAAALILTLLHGACGSADAPPAPRPSFIVILTDDQRHDEIEHMPAVVQRLAGEGVTFDNAFVTTPLCCPSRASVLTAVYAHKHGIKLLGGAPIFDARSTLATWLHGAGYRTALIGKYMNDNAKLAPRIPAGWDTWITFADEPRSFLKAALYYDYRLNENGVMTRRGHAPEDYSTDVLRNLAVRFVRESAGQPFLLLFTPFAPHLPAIPAARHGGRLADVALPSAPSFQEADTGDKPAYVAIARRLAARTVRGQPRDQAAEIRAMRVAALESLLAVDEAVAALLDTLEELGRADDTVVIYTADNGVMWGEHWLLGKSVPYEEAIRVPLIIRYPRLIQGLRRDGHLVLNLDLAPTVAELAGVAVPERVDGRSLVPLLRAADTNGAVPWRSDFLIESFSTVPAPHRAVRSDRWKYVRNESDPPFEELYDLTRDPHEMENLLVVAPADPTHRDTAATMRTRLQALERE